MTSDELITALAGLDLDEAAAAGLCSDSRDDATVVRNLTMQRPRRLRRSAPTAH